MVSCESKVKIVRVCDTGDSNDLFLNKKLRMRQLLTFS